MTTSLTTIGGMDPASARGGMVPDGKGGLWTRRPGTRKRWRLAIFDEELVTAEFGLDLASTSVLDPKTATLLQLGVSVAIGSSAACLEWSVGRALAAGATKDEIADVLLAIAPVAGIGRVVSAAPPVATALDYDIEAALGEPDDH